MRVTVEEVRLRLHYDPATGVFTWSRPLSPVTPIGSLAGAIYKNGRRYITIHGRRYFASHLAWLYVHGVWPSAQVDHKNVTRDDNRIDNLRLATNQQNGANKPALPNNRLGIKGVGVSKVNRRAPQRYRARIRVNDKLIHLGYFSTPQEASAAYHSAAVRYFGEFARSA